MIQFHSTEEIFKSILKFELDMIELNNQPIGYTVNTIQSLQNQLDRNMYQLSLTDKVSFLEELILKWQEQVKIIVEERFKRERKLLHKFDKSERSILLSEIRYTKDRVQIKRNQIEDFEFHVKEYTKKNLNKIVNSARPLNPAIVAEINPVEFQLRLRREILRRVHELYRNLKETYNGKFPKYIELFLIKQRNEINQLNFKIKKLQNLGLDRNIPVIGKKIHHILTGMSLKELAHLCYNQNIYFDHHSAIPVEESADIIIGTYANTPKMQEILIYLVIERVSEIKAFF
jgi:hypothetical protein